MEQNVNFDYQRGERTGIPEAIFCEGKTKETILGLLEKFSSEGAPPVLFTRLAADIFHDLKRKFQKQYRYDETAGVAFRQPLNQEIYSLKLMTVRSLMPSPVWKEPLSAFLPD